ncbi:MAG: type II toxin-antitoxin system RelE/ParE family toxin [Brevundimonas sp.]|uniref:type II toxin-antitoxin system RelE/ParE family toxin n=1 Tax=Brevundimonas sp. TaxID=1871086 RepID=UPI002726721C|nr:type II toxin-antitoxin system RelE/ParE family toxin [Brevundimonas sp.]MDO9587600.1 type II toxin-antitoxin system RelE/ParE family toxin [Brevundimonas sp.]MDP3657712.1 type II toxin-antitoxin system RelE/ParE family toxin [Brevundimonas sp.]MDZ4112727.1 type II toxin-antitoxin system RelE/ParE family toxin [Brevundimonas sp.]
MRVRLTSRANLDIRQQIDWLIERSPRSAEKAANAIFDAIGRLQSHPLSGRMIASGERETLVRFGQFGFVVRYEARRREVIVVRILHGAQDRA